MCRLYNRELRFNGGCGDDMVWWFDSSGVLNIIGSGKMSDFAGKVPWSIETWRISKVVVGEGVKSIAADAFSGCGSMHLVQLPQSLEEIGGNAFKNCYSLIKINIPKNVKTIAPTAFKGSMCIMEFSVDKENEYFTADEFGVMFNKKLTKLEFYPPNFYESKCFVPSTVTELGDNAFNNALGLKSIVFYNTFSGVINDSIFDDCSSITDVYFTGSEEEWNKIYLGTNSKSSFYNAQKHFNYVPVIPATSIELSSNFIEMTAGETETLTATVKPSNATEKNVKWMSEDESVATVKDGVVTAVSVGDAYVLAYIEESATSRGTNGTGTASASSSASNGSSGSSSSGGLSGANSSSGSSGGVTDRVVGYCRVSVSEKYGENISWTAAPSTATNGFELVISGKGEMPDSEAYPWAEYIENTGVITIEDGITSIGKNAFMNFTNVSMVYLPESVEKIGEGVFIDVNLLRRLLLIRKTKILL